MSAAPSTNFRDAKIVLYFDPGLLNASTRAQDALTRLARRVRNSGEAIRISWPEVTAKSLVALHGVGKRTIREIIRVALVDSPLEGERLADEWKNYDERGPRCPHCKRPI